MKLLTTLLFCLGLFGQMSVQEVIALAKSGASKDKIQDALANQGLSFELDRKNLKALKSAGIADWLIDEIVQQDVGTFSEVQLEGDGYPRRYRNTYSYYDPFDEYWYDPWDPFYSSAFYFFSPFYWYRTWDYYNSGYYLPSYYTRYYRNVYPFYYGGETVPGNRIRARNGYRNSVDDRVVGTARHRGSKSSASSSSSSSSRRTATSTSNRSSSSRSSSGGKVTRRGYKKN